MALAVRVGVLLLVVAALAQQGAASSKLNVFFVNDLRYHLFPTKTDTSADLCEGDVTACFGGLVGLSDLRTAQASDVWLHAGVAMGESAGIDDDYYRLLKHGTAVDGLNLLTFDGMSVDADMFRFGRGREVTGKLNSKGVLSCANCDKDLTGANVQPFRRFRPNGATCDVVVIGVINVNKTHTYLPRVELMDEVQGVQDAVKTAQAANNAPALYVVVGEMESATVEKVLALDGVSVVLSSGTASTGTNVVSTINAGKTKVSSTLPTEAALAMNVGQLALDLDDKCAPTNVQAATMKSYHATKNTDTTKPAAVLVNQALSYINENKFNVKSAMELSGDLDPCGFISCAVGQMAADGVHALVNAPDQNTTAVIIPAGYFGGKLPTAFNWTALLTLTPNDPFFCRKDVTPEQLYGMLDDLLSMGPTFPQVSGLLVDQYPAEDGLRIVTVWTRTPGLAMRPIERDATTNVTVAMPCLAMQSLAMQGRPRVDAVVDSDATTVTLSEGLRRSLRLVSATDAYLVLPPQVEQRVRLYIADQTRAECEDWVGMTVTYTLLVLGAMVMLAYQGYQLWRFRTTLSYIR